IKRLSRFSCIGLWCGNNENNEAWHKWGWQIGLGKDTKERLWSDYQNLFNNILPTAVKLYSNNNSYWESSPLYGRGDPRFQTEGDAHDWGIWHDEMKFESFEQRVPRFMSEAGFQSLPSLSTILSFCPKDELNLESKSMLAHQKHPRGNKLIQEYLQRDLPQPNNFESLIYLNQLNQAEGMGIAINAHRRAKPYCMGTLYWQFNDCWPGLSWSSRDYFGHWKAFQHKTKELYQPLLVSTRRSGNIIEIFASSDIPKPINASLNLTINKLSGELLFKENLNIKLQTNQSKRVYTIDLDKLNFKLDEHNSAISIVWIYENHESSLISFFTKLKDLNLIKPNFNIEQIKSIPQGYEFQLSSDHICKAVYLEENNDIQFFPNFIDMLPNRPINVRCSTKLKNLDLKQTKIISLFDHLNIKKRNE
ncbi:MAG: glycoside hydrolase family 2 protein, partial [Saprospiraceae bacterium]